MEEIWKEIPGWEGLYMASNTGKIKGICHFVVSKGGCLRRTHSVVLKEKINKFGYLVVRLQDKSTSRDRFYMVHRLIANTFIPNTQNLPFINHKDEDKTNNCVDNLEWCTAKYNVNYGTCQERKIETQRLKHPNMKRIRQISMNGMLIREFISISDAARSVGVDKTRISRCCHNSNYSCRGFKWEFV